MTIVGVWVAAFVTLAAMSLLFKENPVYRFVEHVFLGVSAGHALVVGFQAITKDAILPMVDKGNWLAAIPILLGLSLYLRFVKGYQNWARVPLAVMIGIGAAVAARSAVQAEFLNQIAATVLPLAGKNMTPLLFFNNLLTVVGVVCVLAYFIFTYLRTWQGPARVAPEIGKWVMMITFGAAFGNAAMGRLSLLVGRITFLLGNWLGIIHQ
jgi:hypothetical protein